MKKIATLLAALLCAGTYAADVLPAEIKNAPKDKVIDATADSYSKVKRPDKDANGKVAAVMVPNDKQRKDFFNFGVICQKYYNATKKVNNYLAIKPLPQDEKYHWYKIPLQTPSAGEVIEDRGHLYMGDWSMGVRLGKYKGKYDYWVSLKFQGPFYVPGSKKETGVYFDQVILIRK